MIYLKVTFIELFQVNCATTTMQLNEITLQLLGERRPA